MRLPILFLLLASLAGCLDDDPAASEPLDADGAADAPSPDLLHLADRQTVLLHRAQFTAGTATAHGLPGDSGNCLQYGQDAIHNARNLTVEATWDAATPLYERLELIVEGSEEVRVQGTSPLRVGLEGLRPHDFFESILVIVQLERPGGVAVQQPVTLDVRMEYEGAPAAAAQQGSCAWG